MGKIEIDKNKDALLIVDLQNDFLPGGTLVVPHGDEIVPLVNSLIPRFGKIFTTQDWHPSDHISFKENGGAWPPHCIADTAGADFHPDLDVSSAIHIHKGVETDKEAYSGFEGTGLADRLRRSGIVRIFVCGLATDYCVKATVLGGIKNGFDVSVIVDAIRGVDVSPGDSETAIEQMRTAGAAIIESSHLA